MSFWFLLQNDNNDGHYDWNAGFKNKEDLIEAARFNWGDPFLREDGKGYFGSEHTGILGRIVLIKVYGGKG